MSVYRPSMRYDLPREIKADAITAKTTSFMLLVTEDSRVSVSVSSPVLAPFCLRFFRTQSCPSLLDGEALAQVTRGSRDVWFYWLASELRFLSSQCWFLSEKDHDFSDLYIPCSCVTCFIGGMMTATCLPVIVFLCHLCYTGLTLVSFEPFLGSSRNAPPLD